jgi:putative transposase
MSRILCVAPSGVLRVAQAPISDRAQEDARLLGSIGVSFTASQGIYGTPRVFLDRRDLSQAPRRPADARESLARPHGYRTWRRSVGKPAVLIPNSLQGSSTVTRRWANQDFLLN